MNLFLTNKCNESCSFCYAETFFKGSPKAERKQFETTMAALHIYADLVKDAPPLPGWGPNLDELTQTYFAARCVNLLGGEPSTHPFFTETVDEIHKLKLGCIVFTNGGLPHRIQRVKDKIWSVTVNGHFAQRAPDLGFPMEKVFANLPLRPEDDVVKALTVIRDAGIKGIFLAFATPAGGSRASSFTPDDHGDMVRMHQLALDFCENNGIVMGYDCSFPLCVDERVGQTKCSSVPVMDAEGNMSICGGDYYYSPAKRHISSFDSLTDLHEYTFGVQNRLRDLPSQFDVCNGCEHFNKGCNGMCLAYRVRDDIPALGNTRERAAK